jgi:hypothetical protein
LLLSRPAESRDQALIQAVLQAWLLLNQPIAQLNRILKPEECMFPFVPVLEVPTSYPDATWVLQQYDFARAKSLLQTTVHSEKPGVFIVSSLKPLSRSRPPHLFQNLSAATPALSVKWVDAFLNLAAQERSWNAASETALVDQLRTTVLSISREASTQSSTLQPSQLQRWISMN